MLFLEPENKIIKDVLEGRLGEKAPRPVEPLEIRLCDFDDVQYDISIANSKLSISMAYAPFKHIASERDACVQLGCDGDAQPVYPECQSVAPVAGFDLTLVANVDSITPATPRIALLKRNILAAPFELCFQALKSGTANTLGLAQIPFRRNESMYVVPQSDRIVIVYSVCFEDKTDQAIARVFLQEFVDTRRSVNNAPPVAFSKDPPLELRGAPGLRASDDLVGYLSLAIFPSHVETDEKRAKAASLVQGFRNYLHYHIKASKTHLHIRMRKRVDLLLQVLNRARPEKDPSKATKKTISGRTFARQ
ncbi:hypothetical protein PINS_up019770 [Pythium insidiosum]|nr:hypothetical protein PINS_up019770 [Pythium insidiosum]